MEYIVVAHCRPFDETTLLLKAFGRWIGRIRYTNSMELNLVLSIYKTRVAPPRGGVLLAGVGDYVQLPPFSPVGYHREFSFAAWVHWNAAAADAACAAARSQTKVQARKRSQAAEAAGAELTRVADGLAASDRAAKTLAKRLQSLNASATGPVAVELRALARSLDASQRDAANARRAVAAAEAKRAAGGYSAPEEELRGELARARDRADALEKELEIARRALDQKDGKVNDCLLYTSPSPRDS